MLSYAFLVIDEVLIFGFEFMFEGGSDVPIEPF